MADEELALEEDEQEEPEAPAEPQQPSAGQSPDYWRIRAEKAERKLKRSQEFTKLQAKYPGLTEEDVKYVDPRGWETIAARLFAQQPEVAAPEEAQTPSVPEPVKQEYQRFVAQAGGQGPAVPPQKMPFAEARALYKAGKVPWSEMRQWVKDGRVEGVEAPPD